MSQFPDDQNLVEFLRQHRPVPPPPAETLEDGIMFAIDNAAQSPRNTPSPLRKRRALWLVPPAIAASLVATFLGYRTSMPVSKSATELAMLETFMETNWRNTLNESSENQLLPVTDEP